MFCKPINSNAITVSFDNNAQSKEVQIHSLSPLCEWNAEESTDWFDINPTEGTSNLITVTVQDNSNGPFRQGDITVTQDSITKKITIKQTGSNSNPTGACCQGSNCNIKTLNVKMLVVVFREITQTVFLIRVMMEAVVVAVQKIVVIIL